MAEIDEAVAQRMVTLEEKLDKLGVSKRALADAAGMKRTSLTNKFSAARAVMAFDEPKSRSHFTEEDETKVANGIRKIIHGLKELLPNSNNLEIDFNENQGNN